MQLVQALALFARACAMTKLPNGEVRTLQTGQVLQANGMMLHELDLSSIGVGAHVASLTDQMEYLKRGGVENLVPSLVTSKLMHSNLGGQGPDSGTEDLRFSNFSIIHGHRLDLIVTEDYDTYKALDNSRNGLYFEKGLPTSIGRINLACGSLSLLRFTLVDADAMVGTEPVAFFFSAYYLGDASLNKFAAISFVDPAPSAFWSSEMTGLKEADKGTDLLRVPAFGIVEDGQNSMKGFDGMADLRQNLITAYYFGTSEFTVAVGSENDDDCNRSEGLDFMFTFTPPAPSKQKEANNAVACQNLDFMNSVVSRSELPTEDGLVYSDVTSYDGKAIDLVVSRVSGNNFGSYAERDALKEGFGRINGQCNSSVKLRFQLVNHDDGFAVVVPKFCLSFADIDAGIDGRCKEAVTVEGIRKPFLADKTDLLITTSNGATTFSAQTRGQGSDNPTNPSAMSDLQSRRAVGFTFSSVSEIVATLTWGPGGFGGRNILFSGGTIA
eukprot:TRINITY_DN68662_c0_g1_i1.p1 TRINITY_DN68662_c0_g1~~TRINITY_DN68662_c0_g1_i1.p1  ORF type:complete len:497 (-),score=72.52 TRINITY_DN68662_c0_g1_i1:235-1725(-)